MVVLVGMCHLDIARRLYDIEIALVPIVETICQREAVALINAPTKTYFGTDMRKVLSIWCCVASVYIFRRRIESVGKLDADMKSERLGSHRIGGLDTMAHGHIDGICRVGIDGVCAAVHQQSFAQRQFPTVDRHFPCQVKKGSMSEVFVGVGPPLVAIYLECVTDSDV